MEESSQNQTRSTDEATAEDDESYAKSSTTPVNSETKNDTTVKVLGMNWDTVADEFSFNLTDLFNYGTTLPVTRRSVLKLSAKISKFDPIGFLTPYTIETKILFQELCLDKVDWDSELEGKLLHTWPRPWPGNSLLEELRFLSNVRIPRCYFRSRPVHFELHGFSDASNRAYAGVIYIRSLYDNGQTDVRLVASKAKVAPLRRQTIPRLELLGTLILARLHRVEEIRKLTSKSDWRQISGKQNPADLPSRGLNAKELSVNTIWWNGPKFLYNPESEWSLSEQRQEEDEVALKEAVKNPFEITHSLVSRSPSCSIDPKIDALIDVKRFSELTKLRRLTAIVVGFVNNLKDKVQSKSKPENGNEILSALNLAKAEELWNLELCKRLHLNKKSSFFTITVNPSLRCRLTSPSLDYFWKMELSNARGG
ncbi:uncharacterized protein [Montipora foliosa]|uniref:uncharacterized protein n=1 Tax=Montipora foliosa TaxID=591990 RepID=UPI0035F111A8